MDKLVDLLGTASDALKNINTTDLGNPNITASDGDSGGGFLSEKTVYIPISIGGVILFICLCCLLWFCLRTFCPRASP